MQFFEFAWALSYSVWDVFNNFLLTDATDRSKISSDQKHFFIALSLYPLSFFANTPFKDSVMLNNVPIFRKEFSSRNKLKFANSNIWSTRWSGPIMFQTQIIWSTRIYILSYQHFSKFCYDNFLKVNFSKLLKLIFYNIFSNGRIFLKEF